MWQSGTYRNVMHYLSNYEGKQMITPVAVEERLLGLSYQIDISQEQLSEAEMIYHRRKISFEIAIARSRLAFGLGKMKLRVGEIADMALIDCEAEYVSLQTAEAIVKAARANANRLRTQVDIVRSIGTSVRASMEAL